MHDPFEESLRRMLRDDLDAADGDQRLGRVLKTAKRQMGIGELIMMPSHWFEALLCGLGATSPRAMSVTRRLSPARDDAAEGVE